MTYMQPVLMGVPLGMVEGETAASRGDTTPLTM
jgi:hypothetical protein